MMLVPGRVNCAQAMERLGRVGMRAIQPFVDVDELLFQLITGLEKRIVLRPRYFADMADDSGTALLKPCGMVLGKRRHRMFMPSNKTLTVRTRSRVICELFASRVTSNGVVLGVDSHRLGMHRPVHIIAGGAPRLVGGGLQATRVPSHERRVLERSGCSLAACGMVGVRTRRELTVATAVWVVAGGVGAPVSYTHLTLPTS